MKNGLDIVEELTPSKMEKEAAHSTGASNVETLATQIVLTPPLGEREKKLWMKVTHLDLLAPLR
jgi:hypothetical protein